MGIDIYEFDARFESEEERAKAIMILPINERLEYYFKKELGCSNEKWEEIRILYKEKYDFILQKMKNEMPSEFYMYFGDLLREDEFDYFHSEFMKDLGFSAP